MRTDKELVKASKFMSFVLRHKPESIGLTLDANGWASIDELIEKSAPARTVPLTRELIEQVVETNEKKRFSISEDGQRIRANQGHSVEVDLGLTPIEPVSVLYHGTATRFLDSILRKGLVKGDRHHVHLSPDIHTANAVGVRHGKLVVLEVAAYRMHQDGYEFFLSTNGVYLTDSVPSTYLRVLNG